jgi:hypothetical protein
MATITTSADVVQIVSPEQMLADVQAAIRAILATGQSYTLFGSRTVTRGDLAELQKMEQLYLRRVLMARGHTGRNSADFSASGKSGTDNVPGVS